VTDLTRLALDAQSGDGRALDQFVVAAYGDVRRLCGALVDQESADDLAQETMIRVLRALNRFRGHSSARTWVLAIARNTCADEIRSRSRRRKRDRRIEQLAAVDAAEPRSVGAALELTDLIARLDPDRRDAYVLTQLLGLSYHEAASVCGCPAGTIHSRVARARDELVALYTGGTRETGQLVGGGGPTV
jgi:RNA polymerase sigma-70 factor (ECF subfamily)